MVNYRQITNEQLAKEYEVVAPFMYLLERDKGRVAAEIIALRDTEFNVADYYKEHKKLPISIYSLLDENSRYAVESLLTRGLESTSSQLVDRVTSSLSKLVKAVLDKDK